MTLVVARIVGDRIAIASDTRLSQNDQPLSLQNGTIKSCMLPGEICVSFANSPHLAERAFNEFATQHPNGTGFTETVSYFEKSSADTGNDYIVAFNRTPRLVKIVDGRRMASTAKTQWIGDHAAYERFREYEAKNRPGTNAGRALSTVLFMDELENSPASDLYSSMRHVVADRNVQSVGDFVCVISNRDQGFRYSVYSDMLYNWPSDVSDESELQYSDPIDLGSSGENTGYSTAQISPGYIGLNLVAFYILKARKLFLFHGTPQGLPSKCMVISNLEPIDIDMKLNELLGNDMRWLLTITSEPGYQDKTIRRQIAEDEIQSGLRLSFFCHANTFPKVNGQKI